MIHLRHLRHIKTTPISTLAKIGGNLLRSQLLKLKKIRLEDELNETYSSSPQFPASLLRAWMTGSRENADRILAHEFDLLGSGIHRLNTNIDWQNPFPANTDVKLPWELSRFQFLPTLIHAEETHSNERYAKEARDLIHDWILKNPRDKGKNWQVPMEAAIRACNFSLAWYFLKNSPSWNSAAWRKTFLTSVVEHGKFIYRNLEYGPGFNTNHFLADITAMLWLGVLFPQFKEAKKWKKIGLKNLELEMSRQVYADGVHAEASISYHRLACELFGYSALLARENEIYLSETFWKTLEEMFEFVWYYTKPNDLAPQIGDSDDGRLFIFEDFYSWKPRDHRYLFKLASILFPNNPKFQSSEQEKGSRGFNFGGIYIMRKSDFYCIVDAGGNGQNGNGGHAHNDTLSFELSVGGEDFIIDPGTYVYTSDPVARNHFRSTAMHNTVMIDEQEMNRFRKNTVFSMHNDAIPQINRFDSDERCYSLDAQHSGYERLKKPITHRRTFQFDKKKLELEITDYFVGTGKHEIQWNFHFAPEVTVEKSGTRIIAQKNIQKLEIVLPPELVQHVSIHNGEVSPRYGVKEKGKVLRIGYRIDSSEKLPFMFLFKAI